MHAYLKDIADDYLSKSIPIGELCILNLFVNRLIIRK